MLKQKKQTKGEPSCLKKMGNDQYAAQLTTGQKEPSSCDVTIIVGEQRFAAHKAVLSGASSYFQGMFSVGFQESTMSEVRVPGTAESFVQLKEFAYTGYFSLSLKTVAGILRMACYMVQQDAMKLCAEYLEDVKSDLSIDDCFEVLSVAKNHDILKELTKNLQEHLVGNFPECGRSPVFLENVSADNLLKMLVDEDIETDSCGEEQILEVVLAWLKHDWEHRQTHAADLLKKLRLGLLPLDKLDELLGEEILSIPECEAMVQEVRRLDATKEEVDVSLVQSHPDMFASRNTITGELNYSDKGPSDRGFILKTLSGSYELHHLSGEVERDEKRYPQFAYVVNNCTEVYVAFGARETPRVDIQGSPQWRASYAFFLDYFTRRNNESFGKLFCKFDLNSDEEYTDLEPMKILLSASQMHLHKLGDYLCVIGSETHRRSRKVVIQRYSLLTKDWADPVVLEAPEGSIVDGHAVVEDHILFICYSHSITPGENCFKVYSPMTHSICKVEHNSSDIEPSPMDLEVDTEGACMCSRGGYRYYKVACDFTSDTPSVKLEVLPDGQQIEGSNRRDSHINQYTCDKRKMWASKVE